MVRGLKKLFMVAFLIAGIFSLSLASTITIWFSWEGQEDFLSIVKNFERSHPNVKVNVVYVPRMIEKLHITLASGGNFPDIALVRNDYLGILVGANKIHPVTVEKVPSNILNAFKVNGKAYAYPFYADIQVVYINKYVFDRTKAPYPSENWTLGDLESIAQHVKENGYIGLLLNGVASYFFNSFNAAFNEGKLPQEDGVPVVTGQGTLKAAKLYNYLFNVKKIAVNYRKMTLVNAFKNNKAGMMLMGSFLVKSFINDGVNFLIWPYPYLEKDRPIPPVLDPKGFVIFKESKAARDFLNYVTSAKVEEKFCLDTYKLPTNSQAAEELGNKNPFFKVMNVSSKRSITLPTSRVFKEGYVRAVGTALKLYLSGKMKLEDAFEKAQEYIEAHK